MRRRDLIGGVAASALLGSMARAQRVVGFAPPANKYANPIPWTLDTAAHPIASPPSRARALVCLWAGQSNMAQYASAIYSAVSAANQFQFIYGDGTLRHFVEPVFGPSASVAIGSWFGCFGDAVIASGRYDNVVHCFTALGGTSASDWGPAGKYHSILTTAFFRLLDAGLVPDFIGVGQGENETFYSLPASEWADNWLACVDVARGIGIASPWIFARQTYNNGAVNSAVQTAQIAVAGLRPSVFAGPDADALGASYRYDNVHWNMAGIQAIASAWASAVLTTL